MYKQKSLKLIKNQSNSQNNLLHLQKSQRNQNKIFISKKQRFNHQIPNADLPGPGSYIDPLARSREVQKIKQHIRNKSNSGNHLDNIVSREHQWIFGTDRMSYLQGNSPLGPGAYQIAKKIPNKISDSWSKSNRFNGSQWDPSQNPLGPGSYDQKAISFQPRRKQMSIFKSKSPKSFLQQLTKSLQKNKNNVAQTDKKIIDQTTKQIEQLEHLAKNQQKQKKQLKMDSVFISKSKRYDLKNPQISIAGPGSYNLQNESFPNIKRRKAMSILIQTHKNHETIKPKPLKNPGPTSYNVEQFNMQKQIQRKISSVKGNMALEARFKADLKKNDILSTMPGPAHYNRQRYIFVDQKQYEHKPLVNFHQKIDVPFLSSSSRIIDPPLTNLGDYNLNQFDVAQKARKKRLHLQKLKAMDISMPGFESTQRRTTFNLSKLMKQQQIKHYYQQSFRQRTKVQQQLANQQKNVGTSFR